MIRIKTGEFKPDDYKLVIHPELTLSQFKTADIPILKVSSPNKMGWTSLWINGSIDGMKAEFTIQFRFEKLQQLIWEFADSKAFSGAALKWRIDGWLLEVIGSPPPYEYDWGFISSGVDLHAGEANIGVTFKHRLLDMGITDFKSFYETRRE